jgi:hypothetical protein
MVQQIPRRNRRVRVRAVTRPVTDPMTGHPSLGFSFDPLSFATTIQNAANRLTTNFSTVAGKVEAAKAKVTTGFDAITGLLNTGGQVIQATSRAAIATGATGDASTGLLGAAVSTKVPTVLIAAGVAAAYFVFVRHPGKRGL